MRSIQIVMCGIASIFLFTNTILAQSLEEGVKMYQYERYATAKKVFEPLAATNPQANYYLGLCELALGNTSVAKAIFSKNPTDIMNQTGMGRVLFAENKATEALALLSGIVNKAKKKEFMNIVHAANAITYSKNTNLDQAIAWYDKVLENNKTDDIYMAKGDAYFGKADGGGQAMRQYRDYALEVAKTENKSLLFYKMGRLWYAAEIYDSSLNYYQQAKDADVANPLPYRDLGNAYSYIGKYEKAKENYEQYIKLGDNTLDDQVNYANILFLTKNYNDAITRVKDLMNKGIEKPYMYRVLGYSYFENKDYPTAMSNLDLLFKKEQADKIIPADYYTYAKILAKDSMTRAKSGEWFDKGINLDQTKNKAKNVRDIGKLFMEAKDYPTASKYYKIICDNIVDKAEANDFYYAGVTDYVTKNFTSAEKYMKEYVNRLPTEPTAYSWLGKVQAQIDREAKTGGAEASYLKFIEMVTDKVKYKDDLIKSYSYLAVLAYNKKDNTTAKMYAQKIIELDPNDKTAKSILAK